LRFAGSHSVAEVHRPKHRLFEVAATVHGLELHWQRPDVNSGNWYAGDVAGVRMEGWLCEALFKYFPDAPPKIFVRCDPLPAGVNPVRDNRPGEGIRFVGPDDYSR
jgi:hypothetical protein